MDYKYIEQLLERYWQCETSLEEEEILRAFFSQKDVPDELQQYRSLFAYEQQAKAEEMLDDSFDERLLAMTGEQSKVKARKIKLSARLMPLAKAAAVVAIILTLGNAIGVSIENGSGYKDEDYFASTTVDSDTLQLLSGGMPVHKSDSMMAIPMDAEIDSMIERILWGKPNR